MSLTRINDLKNIFFKFFVNYCGCSKIKGASLVPEVDTSVLYTTAGMHPLIPFLAGEMKHPQGNRLVNIQKVVRTGAINEVGLQSCLTFFELFGVWLIGEYNKYNVLSNVWEFLTSQNFLNIPKDALFVTCFKGNEKMPADTTTVECWKNIGIDLSHIHLTTRNWKGPYSSYGIAGPNTRIFIDTQKPKCSEQCNVFCDCGKFVELWDVVFFDFLYQEERYIKAITPSVDMGAGVERLAAVMQKVSTVYDTNELNELIKVVDSLSEYNGEKNEEYVRSCRIIADHFRCLSFILGDENSTIPSNNGRGYVLRKIIRRMTDRCLDLKIDSSKYDRILCKILDLYGEEYPLLIENKSYIFEQLLAEYDKYMTIIEKNSLLIEKKIKNKAVIKQQEIENLHNTYGVSEKIIESIVHKYNIVVVKDNN